MIGVNRPEAVPVNKVALVLVTTLATVIGITPYILWIGRPWLLILFVLGALVISALATLSFTTQATEAPGPLDFLLGGVGAISRPAAAGLMGILWYWSIFAVTWLIVRVASWFGAGVDIAPESVAYYGSLVIMGLMALASVAPAALKLAKQTYPQTAGLRSAFYSLIRFRRKQMLAKLMPAPLVLGVGLLIALLAPEVPHTWWFSLLMAWALIVVSAPLGHLGEEKVTEEGGNTIDAIRKLFEAGGYQVIASPRTGRDDIDPLLVDTADLYAESQERAFAIEVKTAGESTESLDWARLSELASAAWALTSFLHEGAHNRSPVVEPLLVLVGLKPPTPVKAYVKKGWLRVVEIEDTNIVSRILKTKDSERLQEFVRCYLSFPEAAPTGSQAS